MVIETKYDVGDVLIPIASVGKGGPCRLCEGKGHVKLSDGAIYTCPRCSGHKRESCGLEWRCMKSCTLTGFSLWGDKQGLQQTSYSDAHGERHTEHDLFPTEAEAQAECDRRNKED